MVDHSPLRFHGLDALRGIAMLLGIVLHAALPYMPNVQSVWPPGDESSSQGISAVFWFIHVWRMPVFFILTGFFANLVVSKRSWKRWWGNRLIHIGLPLVVFSPIMSLTLPWIFAYGRSGEFVFFYSNDGQPFHLWFLWHLILFVILSVLFRFSYLFGIGVLQGFGRIGLGIIGIIIHKLKSIGAGILFRSRFPLGFIVISCVVNLPSGGELAGNVAASGLYFLLGYSLYGNPSLFIFLKSHWTYYLLTGVVGFTLYMVLGSNKIMPYLIALDMPATEYLRVVSGPFGVIAVLINIICAVSFSYAFIGLSEKHFGYFNPQLRFISDGAYWIYLIHLPIVTLTTFAMFKLPIPIEMKFSVAIGITSLVCLLTYKLFVRSTLIGVFLNGRRISLDSERPQRRM